MSILTKKYRIHINEIANCITSLNLIEYVEFMNLGIAIPIPDKFKNMTCKNFRENILNCVFQSIQASTINHLCEDGGFIVSRKKVITDIKEWLHTIDDDTYSLVKTMYLAYIKINQNNKGGLKDGE